MQVQKLNNCLNFCCGLLVANNNLQEYLICANEYGQLAAFVEYTPAEELAYLTALLGSLPMRCLGNFEVNGHNLSGASVLNLAAAAVMYEAVKTVNEATAGQRGQALQNFVISNFSEV